MWSRIIPGPCCGAFQAKLTTCVSCLPRNWPRSSLCSRSALSGISTQKAGKEECTKNLIAAFQREHQQRYGYAHPSRAIELVTLRLRAVVKSQPLKANLAHVNKRVNVGTAALGPPGRARLGSPFTPKAPVLFGGKKLWTAIRSRNTLQPGKKYSGPAIVTEYSATTVVPPGNCFHVDAAANLIVTIR
jgi:N-methylhydantoinase A